MLAFGVQNPEYDNTVVCDAVKELVGEPTREQSTEPAVIRGAPVRLRFQQENRLFDLSQKLVTQTCLLRLVPLTGLLQICFGPGADDDRPFHAAFGLRMRASTSCQGEPALGVWR
jgi:hypothetical protein